MPIVVSNVRERATHGGKTSSQMEKKTFREVFNIAISGIPEKGGFLPFPLNMERNLGANCPGGNKPNSHFHFSLWFTLNNFSSEMQNKQSFYLNCSQILKYFN